jgi:hypothetical protein
LVFALLMVEDILNLESHSLAWPHIGDLAEPAICDQCSLAVIIPRC